MSGPHDVMSLKTPLGEGCKIRSQPQLMVECLCVANSKDKIGWCGFGREE